MKPFRNLLIGSLLWLPFAALAESFPAELAWADSVALSVPVSGVVDRVNAQAGQRVAVGSVLLALDTRVFKANLAAAEAQLKSANIDLQEAQREFHRAEELYASTVLSDRDLQLAEIAYEKVNAQYEAARADVARAEFELDHAVIKAPFDAWVVQRAVMPGEVLMQTFAPKTLLTVARHDAMRAVAAVPVAAVTTLQLGQTVDVRVSGETLQGKIAAIETLPQQGRYAVAVEFAVAEGQRYLPGIAAEVELP